MKITDSFFKKKLEIQKFNKYPITYGAAFRDIRNRLNYKLRAASNAYYRNKLSQVAGDSKKTWKVLNEVMGRGTSGHRVEGLLVADQMVNDHQIISDSLNKHFAEVGQSISGNLPNSPSSFLNYMPNLTPENQFYLKPLDMTTLRDILSSLKSSAPGYDEIPLYLYASNFDLLGEVLLYLVNRSLTESVFPASLKIARVVPIHKKGSRSDAGNYRPVSVLPSLSKIIEKIVCLQLFEYFTVNKILTNSQFGFRPNNSTEKAANNMLEYIYGAITNKEFCLGVYLDLTKAFDTIDREILLRKLSRYGVSDSSCQWFKSYLSHRLQYVCVNGVNSSKRSINTGIVQGSTSIAVHYLRQRFSQRFTYSEILFIR